MHVLARAPAAALLIAILFAGCGGRGGGDSSAAAWRGALGPANQAVPTPPGRRCGYMDSPASLPTLEDVLGVGARGSLNLWGFDGDPSDSVMISIRYDSTGVLDWVRLIGGRLSMERTAELERLVRDHVPGHGKEDWGVRLLLTGDGTPAAVLPAVACEATQHSRMPTPPPIGSRREMAELYSALQGRSMEARVLVDEEGRVIDAELMHSSGSRLLDQYAVDLVRQTRFQPKLHDGFPVVSVTRMRFRFRRY